MKLKETAKTFLEDFLAVLLCEMSATVLEKMAVVFLQYWVVLLVMTLFGVH